MRRESVAGARCRANPQQKGGTETPPVCQTRDRRVRKKLMANEHFGRFMILHLDGRKGGDQWAGASLLRCWRMMSSTSGSVGIASEQLKRLTTMATAAMAYWRHSTAGKSLYKADE